MNRKKLLSLLLAAVLLFSASACGLDVESTEPQISQSITEATEIATEPAADTQATEAETEPSSDPVEDPTEPSEEETQATQPETQPTQPPQTQPPQTQPTQPPQQETQPTQPEPQPTEAPTEPEETKPSGSAAIIDAAYALGKGEKLDGKHTLTGVITSIKTAYNSKYGNITVIISVPGSEDQPIQCYRLEGAGVDDLLPGDTVTVTGVLKNYEGTIEFDAGCHLDAVSRIERPETPSNPPASNNDDSKEYVAWYIHTYGCLPDFYMTKSQAEAAYGWTGGPLDKLAPGMCIGGDRFTNYQKVLPVKSGRYYTECDIDTIGANARGAKRIVFSNDGLVYYTDDHYETFTLMYGEP